MGYTEDAWKTAKARYTAATNKKKPGAKFLGVFTKASGLEPLFAKFDKLPLTDFANRRTTIDTIRTKALAYLGVLDKAATDDAASSKDATVKQNLALANKTLRADVEALLAHVEAEYAHELEEWKVQRGTSEGAEENKRKKNEGRGMVNFGPDVAVPQELVAAVKQLEAAMLTITKTPTAATVNGAPLAATKALHGLLAKFGKAVEPEYKSLNPFVNALPTNAGKASVDNWVDQVSIAVKRLKPKLKM